MKKALLLFIITTAGLYMSAQQPIWTAQYESKTRAFNRDIAIGPNGFIYSCGYFYETLRQPNDLPGQNLKSEGGADIYISKHTPQGVLLWATQIKGTGEDRAHSIVLDDEGHIYVSGAFQDTIVTSEGDSAISNGLYDGLLVKADSNVSILWLKSFGGKMNDEAHKVILSKDNNLIIGGYYTDSMQLDTSRLI